MAYHVVMNPIEKLKELFVSRAIRFGDFTLASGKKSSYYIDSKRVLFHSQAIAMLGEAIREKIQDIDFDAIGGLEVGAIPMTAAVLTSWGREGYNVEGFFVRKKPKEHGSQQLIEGIVKSGDRVIVLDDVLTTGGSVLRAIHAVEAVGAVVVRVVCICDRLQGAAKALEKYDYQPIFTVKDFGINPE